MDETWETTNICIGMALKILQINNHNAFSSTNKMHFVLVKNAFMEILWNLFDLLRALISFVLIHNSVKMNESMKEMLILM